MASQPVSAANSTRISGTAAGTTVVAATPVNLMRVYVPANRTGTASFYNATTGAGTAAGNFLFDLANTVGSIPTNIEVGVRCNRGLTVVVGGTVDFNVIWE
jgi:hypothetical protein